jgi:hypothetical protein
MPVRLSDAGRRGFSLCSSERRRLATGVQPGRKGPSSLRLVQDLGRRLLPATLTIHLGGQITLTGPGQSTLLQLGFAASVPTD